MLVERDFVVMGFDTSCRLKFFDILHSMMNVYSNCGYQINYDASNPAFCKRLMRPCRLA